MNPNATFKLSAKRLLPALLLIAATLLIGAQSASASSGGIGTTPTGGTGGDDTSGNSNLTPAKYERLWTKVPAGEKRWARGVSECESGRDPDATALGGDYRGAFMFTPDAWETSPKTPGGDPIDFSYKTQAVVAVALKARDGTGPWPVCG